MLGLKNLFSVCADTKQILEKCRVLPTIRFEPGTAGWEAGAPYLFFKMLYFCHEYLNKGQLRDLNDIFGVQH